eukprot:3334275-Rhodomonas_salina.1
MHTFNIMSYDFLRGIFHAIDDDPVISPAINFSNTRVGCPRYPGTCTTRTGAVPGVPWYRQTRKIPLRPPSLGTRYRYSAVPALAHTRHDGGVGA